MGYKVNYLVQILQIRHIKQRGASSSVASLDHAIQHNVYIAALYGDRCWVPDRHADDGWVQQPMTRFHRCRNPFVFRGKVLSFALPGGVVYAPGKSAYVIHIVNYETNCSFVTSLAFKFPQAVRTS